MKPTILATMFLVQKCDNFNERLIISYVCQPVLCGLVDFWGIAQWIEHTTSNRMVTGSSPVTPVRNDNSVGRVPD